MHLSCIYKCNRPFWKLFKKIVVQYAKKLLRGERPKINGIGKIVSENVESER